MERAWWEAKLIVVFDGLCNFCNGWTRFVIRRDRASRFRFVSAQSKTGAGLLESVGVPSQDIQTIVLIDGPRHYEKSDAVLQILRRLDGAWFASRLLLLLPKGLRDACYTAFARRRYRWFGKTDACPLPNPGWRDRFLS